MPRRPRPEGAMHVVTNRRAGKGREYVTHLLRRSYREGGKVKKETLANLSHLPDELIELIRRSLRGERFLPAGEAVRVVRSRPHGHVQALLAVARSLGFPRLLDRAPSKERSLVLAMVIQRVLEPGSKLACARALAQSTLAEELAIEGADADDLYGALDWLLARQGRIEERLARRHLEGGTLVLYDVTSSYFEGRSCPLARRGYSRDRRRGSVQVVYGLLLDRQGRPIAVEVFDGSVHDDKTLLAQVEKLRRRFKLKTVVLALDRGMVTEANLAALRAEEEIAWISALKAPAVKRLVKEGQLQLSLFDQLSLAEIESVDYPGERLLVCRNPLVAEDRTRTRGELLAATERLLAPIAERVKGGTLRGKAEIGLAVGQAANRFKVKKHFEFAIEDERFAYRRKEAQIAEEAALDGIYVLRTSVPIEELSAPDVVRSYKALAEAERAFRTLKGPELEIRPIHHRLEERVRAHVFLCMLAYYLEWHLRRAWAELTFEDEAPPIAADPVAKAERSPEAKRKASRKRTAAGQPCHSFRSLLRELALVMRNTVELAGTGASFATATEPGPLQTRALELAGVAQKPL